MQLNEAGLVNRLAKRFAGPLSRIVSSVRLEQPLRGLDAYLNFLMGKGAGEGWDLKHEVRTALSTVNRRAPTFFDAGANRGNWSAEVLALVPDARIFMFEPSPACQQHIAGRTLSNTTLVPKALGENPGTARLFFSSSLDASASLHERGDSYFQQRDYKAIEVAVTTIDAAISEFHVDFVDFLKMDIEGHELSALRGAATALSQKKIGALSFEFSSSNINSRTFFRDFWNLLSANGFCISRLLPGGGLSLIRNYYEDLEYFRGGTNYVGVLREQPKRGGSTANERE